MKYYFTSDTHFGHEKIISYCNKPFKSVEEMDEKLIKNWNDKVKDEDVVFHLGDFSMIGGNINKYLSRLNGNIIWIKGNHDKKPIIQDLIIEHGGHHWHLAHKPEECEGTYNLCGHVHEVWKSKKQKNGKVFVNVGVDVWDFKPVTIKEILNEIKKYKE